MLISNINGTAQYACACESWLQHWVNFSGWPVPAFCPVVGCLNRRLVGAHVQIAGDNRWYIFPLCAACNQADGALDVSDVYPLVSANQAYTCARPFRR